MILDRKTLETLYYQYEPRLKRYAERFIIDEKLSEDMIQDVFIKLWDKYQNLEDDKWYPLLFTMVRNRCLDYLKHLAVKRTVVVEILNLKAMEELLYIEDLSGGVYADYPLLSEELKNQIRKITDNLPSRCRKVFLLSRIQGLKNREIAQMLSISEKTVEKHISLAIKELRCNLVID